MKKSILLLGYNFYPEPTGIGKYSGEQIKWLAQNGYDCTVIASYPYYPFWKVQEPYHSRRRWYKTEVEHFASGGMITTHRCPMFIPQNPSGIKRVLLDLSFFMAAFFKLLYLLPGKKYDIVITILPSVSLGLLGMFYKKLRGAKLICHVHDLQIEAARDLKMIKSEQMINMLFRFEKFIFDNCDVITCVGKGMARKVEEKARKDVSLFFNTTDLDQFHPLKNRVELKQLFGFKPTDKVILYSGAIGEKQGIEAILHAAEENKGRPSLKFVICGSGPYKNKLQVMAEKMSLQNVIFMPLQPIEKFNQFLNMADVHLIVQKANAGDLVMPSKLNTVLAIGGLALVTANKGSGMHTLLEQHNMGILVEAENQQALNKGIQKALTENKDEMKRNARHYAESYLSIDKIMKSFENSFLIQNTVTHQVVHQPSTT
ncbi:WcaI family glycosyltransferase [Pontibacter virosus]|uniref:Colanic acid biosynthesis glycosyl transferase WcaI n=1 Tax=Pontibacter virosus TaxID=1765052 RepID=A0A2U1AQQ5_9BACT|nr:WcaI family glycosyltransferase [Pontibacter virosus]PVY38667.1 colanic acid biosynthesis glycosyl transferase WcaI [Pontibacter virosus]